MGNQQEFDTKINQANESLDQIATAINDERAQIQQFIDNNPGVNTSSLDGVLARLAGVAGSVGGIFDASQPAPENPNPSTETGTATETGETVTEEPADTTTGETETTSALDPSEAATEEFPATESESEELP